MEPPLNVFQVYNVRLSQLIDGGYRLRMDCSEDFAQHAFVMSRQQGKVLELQWVELPQ